MEEVRSSRKALVNKINNDLLPLADQNLVTAQAVVTLFNRTNRKIKAIESQRKIDYQARIKQQQYEEEQKVLQQISQEKQKPLHQAQAQAATKPKPRSTEEDKRTLRKQSSTDSLQHYDESDKSSPRYKITDTSEYAVIDLLLPYSEHAEELDFEINNYEHELIVKGNQFEIPFRINGERYTLSEARVRVQSSQHVKIYIPKRRVSRYLEPQRYQRRRADPWEVFQDSYQPRYYGSQPKPSFFF